MPKQIRHWMGLVWKKCPVSSQHIYSTDLVLPFSKTVHFLDPPCFFADVINGCSLTPQSVTSSVQSQIDHCENSYFSHIPSIIIPSGHTH